MVYDSLLCCRFIEQKDLFTVLDVLKRHNYGASNYDKLGLALGLLYQKIKNIRANNRDVENCLQDVIDSWLTDSTDDNPATWEKLVVAVENDNKAAAEGIEKESK